MSSEDKIAAGVAVGVLVVIVLLVMVFLLRRCKCKRGDLESNEKGPDDASQSADDTIDKDTLSDLEDTTEFPSLDPALYNGPPEGEEPLDTEVLAMPEMPEELPKYTR